MLFLVSVLKKAEGKKCVSPWVEDDRICEGSWCRSSHRLPSAPEDLLPPRWAGFILLRECLIARSGGLGGCVKSSGLIIATEHGEGQSPVLGCQWDVVGELNC